MKVFGDLLCQMTVRSDHTASMNLQSGWIITLDGDQWRKATPSEGGTQALIVEDCKAGDCPLVVVVPRDNES